MWYGTQGRETGGSTTRETVQYSAHRPGVKRVSRLIAVVAVCAAGVACGAINPGKLKWIEWALPGENYYLVKDMFLTAGSAHLTRESFDHAMDDTVHLFFIPSNEKHVYTAESTWYDPAGVEYRTIRTTYDKAAEGKKGIERPAGGSRRSHSISTKELYDHKPGMWKVTLFMDGDLVRTRNFSVR